MTQADPTERPAPRYKWYVDSDGTKHPVMNDTGWCPDHQHTVDASKLTEVKDEA